MKKLLQPIDNAPLILFRIFFGFLFAAETFGAILTGWVKDNFITPKFTFSHIGFEWLQPLPGAGMFLYFVAMGILSLAVMVGYKYRASIIALTMLWFGVYLMQKTSYNNHYYLLLLISALMCIMPAHAYASFDAKSNPSLRSNTMPQWCSFVFIAQISIVYFFATAAKFYPDWLDGTFTKNLLAHVTGIDFIDHLFAQKWFYLFIAYAGIAFDGLIIPMLLFKKTRTLAVCLSLVFHIFNSIVLQIGIFPYFALSFAVFFYPPELVRKRFFKKKTPIADGEKPYRIYTPLFVLLAVYFIVQLLLPVRHWFIPGDVLYTEEGHRLSWRMMLRSRSGYTAFRVVDTKTQEDLHYSIFQNLTFKQIRGMEAKPDMIWQLAQRIKNNYASQGIDVAVYVDSHVSVNQKQAVTLIDPKVDLAAVKWNYFGHDSWVNTHFEAPKYP